MCFEFAIPASLSAAESAERRVKRLVFGSGKSIHARNGLKKRTDATTAIVGLKVNSVI